MAPLTQGHTFVLLDYHEFGGTVCPESQPQPSKFPLIAANCSQQPQQTGSVSTVCHSDSCAEQVEHSQPGSGLLPLPTQQVEHAQPVSGLLPTPRVRRHSLVCARKDAQAAAGMEEAWLHSSGSQLLFTGVCAQL